MRKSGAHCRRPLAIAKLFLKSEYDRRKIANDAAIKIKSPRRQKVSARLAGIARRDCAALSGGFGVYAFGLRPTTIKRISDLAERLYQNLKKITFSNGLVEAQAGPRPVGLGAQFYLMMGALGEAATDIDAAVYFNYAAGSAQKGSALAGNRFFSDARYPNRLEYHRTSVEYKRQTYKVWVRKKLVTRVKWTPLPARANYHDDYAFIDAAELGLAAALKLNTDNPKATALQNPLNYTDDGELQVQNDGTAIKIYDLVKKRLISWNKSARFILNRRRARRSRRL